ncbi:hypothetical protein [Streptomyces exfoliatus]|uniref:hypothetical protein n=1 Tax=Streptomyces exfoliatus TaxID=1905 RepID=UPI003C2B22D0
MTGDEGLRLEVAGPHGTAVLGGLFESSWPGLFLAGLLTAPSYGPSMRFVFGAGYTAPRLVRGVRRRLRGGKAPVAA